MPNTEMSFRGVHIAGEAGGYGDYVAESRPPE